MIRDKKNDCLIFVNNESINLNDEDKIALIKKIPQKNLRQIATEIIVNGRKSVRIKGNMSKEQRDKICEILYPIVIKSNSTQTNKEIAETVTQKCPFCGEEILAVAKKCKHCSTQLVKSTPEIEEYDYGLFLLAIPLVSTLLIWLWVKRIDNFYSLSDMLYAQSNKMWLILFFTILGTAVLATMETKKSGIKSDKLKGIYSPTTWFLFITLLWIVGYPIYLYKRKFYGLANRGIAGLVIAIIFLGSYGGVLVSIEKKKSVVISNLQ